MACYNFGSPRVGNKEFTKEWNSKITEAYRVVHRADLVPMVPFQTIAL